MAGEEIEWSEADRARFTASQMLGLLAAREHPAGDLEEIRYARSQLLPALDRLMDEPMYSDMHGEAVRRLAHCAEIHDAPDLLIDDRY